MEPFPASPEPEHNPSQQKGPAPTSVQTAVKLIWAGVAVSVLSTLLTFVFLDDVVDAAVEGAGGSRDAARTGAMVGIVVGLVLGVALAALFAYFIGKGANWARIVYSVLTVFGILASLVGLGGLPPVLLVVSLVSLAISIAVLFFLYRPESNRYFSAPRSA